MNLNNKNICFVSAYAAPYGGNFIKMLQALALRLKNHYNCHICFIFPMQSDKDWLEELSTKYEVGYVGTDNVSTELSIIFDNWNIDMVHTHFESYDIPVAKAIKISSRQIKQVWHIHDYMSLDKRGLSLPKIRKFFTNQRFWEQYGKWGKSAYFIAVSDEMAQFVNHYRSHRFKYPRSYKANYHSENKLIRTECVINGIDLSRIDTECLTKSDDDIFTFLTFGGESISKGISTIFNACELLSKKKLAFKLFLTEGYTTSMLLNDRFGKRLPEWLVLIKQTNNISDLFSESDCYISASRRETMSMAIAEASLFGLPVIQSDIPGTLWNASRPSSFLFPVDDAAALCEAMMRVINLSKNGEMQKLVDQTRTLNLKQLSMDLWVDRIIDIYKKI